MFLDGKPIGHARNVVRNCANVFMSISNLKLWREKIWLLEERAEKVLNHNFRFSAHARNPEMLVEVSA